MYSVGIGLFAGRWLSGNPLLAALLGIAIALTIGVAIDRVTASLAARRARRRVDQTSAEDDVTTTVMTTGVG